MKTTKRVRDLSDGFSVWEVAEESLSSNNFYPYVVLDEDGDPILPVDDGVSDAYLRRILYEIGDRFRAGVKVGIESKQREMRAVLGIPQPKEGE